MNITSFLVYSIPFVFILLSFSANKQLRVVFIVYAGITLFLVLSLRENLGFDYSSYLRIFNSNDDCHYGPVNCGILFISRFFESYLFFFSIYAFFTVGCILFVSFSERSPFVFLNYVCLPWFYIESFSIIRQELSVSLAIVMYYFFQKKGKNTQFLLFGLLSVFVHMSSALFVLLLVYLKYFYSKNVSRLIFIFTSFVSVFLILFYDYIIPYYPILKFYNEGGSFGYGLFALFVMLFVVSYKNVGGEHGTYILALACFIYIGTLEVDSRLARIAIPFIIPALWYRWDVLFNKILLKGLKIPISFFACVFLYVLMMYIKSTNSVSSLIPYNSFLFDL